MLKKSASIVLASFRGSTYRSVRLASSLAAALLDGLLSILRAVLPLSLTCGPLNFHRATIVFRRLLVRVCALTFARRFRYNTS